MNKQILCDKPKHFGKVCQEVGEYFTKFCYADCHLDYELMNSTTPTTKELPMPIPPYNMTRDELLELHKTTCSALLDVMTAKNKDYSGGGGIFDNFKASVTLGVHPVIGVLLRCQDKFKRVQAFLTNGKLAVEGEGVFDAIDDTINYMILIKGILLEEQRNKPSTKE